MFYNIGLAKFSCKYIFLFLIIPIIDCVKFTIDYLDVEDIIMPYSGIPFYFQLTMLIIILLFIIWCYFIDIAFDKISV